MDASPREPPRAARMHRALDNAASNTPLRFTARALSGLVIDWKRLHRIVEAVWHHESPPDTSVISGDVDPVVLVASEHEEGLAISALANNKRNVAG